MATDSQIEGIHQPLATTHLSDNYAVPIKEPLDIRHEPPTHLVNGNVNVGYIPQPTKTIRRYGSDGVDGVGRKADGLNLL